MPLCQDCSGLDLRTHIVKVCRGEDVSQNPLLGYEPPKIPYKSSVSSIQASIESTHCQLCTVIWDKFADPAHHETKDHPDKPFHFTVSLSDAKTIYLSVYQIRSLSHDQISYFDHNQILGQLGLVHRFGLIPRQLLRAKTD
jgi:hypothetical protein